jgi:hypothetical protein
VRAMIEENPRGFKVVEYQWSQYQERWRPGKFAGNVTLAISCDPVATAPDTDLPKIRSVDFFAISATFLFPKSLTGNRCG